MTTTITSANGYGNWTASVINATSPAEAYKLARRAIATELLVRAPRDTHFADLRISLRRISTPEQHSRNIYVYEEK